MADSPTPDEVEALLAGRLDEESARRLLARIAAEPATLASLAEQWRMHRLLAAEARPLSDTADARLAKAVATSRSPSASGAHFAARVASRVAQRRRQPRTRPRRWLVASMLVAAAAALAAMVWLYDVSAPSPASGAVVAAVSGSVRIGDQPAAVSRVLYAGEALHIAADSSATVTYADGTELRVAGGSQLLFDAAAPGKRLRLERGSLTATVAPQPAGAPLVIATAQADAIVRGTRLTLDASADQSRLEVAQGVVDFARGTELLTVARGGAAVAAEGRPLRVLRRELVRIDVSGGRVDDAVHTGTLAPDPLDPARTCVTGRWKRDRYGDVCEIRIERAGVPLYRHEAGARLECEVLRDPGPPERPIELCLWDETQRQSLLVDPVDAPAGRWHRIVLPLDAFARAMDDGTTIVAVPGDLIMNVVVSWRGPAGSRLAVRSIAVIVDTQQDPATAP